MANGKSRPASAFALFLLVLFQGLSGIAGGFGLIMDPSGQSLQIPIEWLEGSPFADYSIPGLVLFIVLGFVPMITSFGLWRGRAWSWGISWLIGVALMIWLAVEIIVIGYHTEPPLQLIYGIVGVLILLFSLLPATKNYYRRK